MKKNLQTAFIIRQHMLSRDFELYYYNDHNLSKVDLHSHNYYEFYFFMEGDVSIQIGTEVYPIHFGDIMLVPPHISHRPIIHSTTTPYRRFVFWISQVLQPPAADFQRLRLFNAACAGQSKLLFSNR